jgi:hypothetical protein
MRDVRGTSQKTAFFIVTAVKTSNLTILYHFVVNTSFDITTWKANRRRNDYIKMLLNNLISEVYIAEQNGSE